MEILKTTTVFALFLCLQFINAQNQKTIQDAFVKSYEYETKSKYNEAIESLRELNLPNNYPVQLRLGWLFYSAKKNTEAISAYRKAAEIMPASIEALLGMANPLIAQKNWVELEIIYIRILKIDEKNSIINFRLGMFYYNLQQYAKAEKYFSTTLNLYPFDYDSMLMSGWNYYFLGRYNESKELFLRVLLYNSADASAKEGLALIK